MARTPTSALPGRSFVPSSLSGAIPTGLWVLERAPEGGWDTYGGPLVVLVHGSLDRASSFGRVARRLGDLALVAYDRRGYGGSRPMGAAEDLQAHVADLIAVAGAYAEWLGERAGDGPATPLCAVGHSVGATVVLGAALTAPARFASVGAYEPSMPWLGFHRLGSPERRGDAERSPAEEAERFFARMIGAQAWERLPEAHRAERRADGPALVSDLRAVRGAAPFDVTGLTVPALLGCGGDKSFSHHRQTVAWLADNVATARVAEIPDAGHGAHISHPDAFADFVRQSVAMAPGAGRGAAR